MTNQTETKNHTNAPMRILPCGCAHDFQDASLGKGLRLHNPTDSGDRIGYRCTVCGVTK